MESRRGFALIELIVMILLLLVLSSSVAVYYRQMMDENRLQIVHNDLIFLRRQVILHRMKHSAPLTALTQLGQLKEGSLTDPWGHEYRLLEGSPPRIVSVGPDGELDPDEGAGGPEGDDVVVALNEAVLADPAAPVPVEEPGAAVEAGAGGFEIAWLHPASRVERLEPCPANTGPSAPGFDRSLCQSTTQGPALYFALVVRRPGADRTALAADAADTVARLEILTPKGSQTLDAGPAGRLPCCVAEGFFESITRRDPGGRWTFGIDDWYRDGVYYRFFKARLEEEPCTGTHHAQLTIDRKSQAVPVASSTLSFVVLEPPQLHIDSTVPVAGTVLNPVPPEASLVFTGGDARLVANLMNGQGGAGMELHFETSLDGQPLIRKGAATLLDEQRFQVKLDWPPRHAPGAHVMKTRLFYRTFENPGGFTLCREWSYSL